ncbi:MAG: hypothetical protein WBC44_21905 [Planctomycetaceae bacterium]
MAKSIYETVDELSTGGMTVRLLGALDWVVPGEYTNLTGFEETIKAVTGETDQQYIQKVGERAIALYNDRAQGYQRALWLYRSVDSVQGMAGATAFLAKLGDDVGFLSFLSRLLPKEDTTQAVDLGLKLVTEVVASCYINGIPGDSVGDFVESLSDYRHEALMRMAALICVDGLLPLGPDFLQKATDLLERTGATKLADNERFQRIRGMLPGDSTKEQLGLIEESLGAVKGWVGGFVSSHDLTQNRVFASVKGLSDKMEGKFDYAAAVLDMTTDYFEHTGTQTVARSLISRAASEV